MPRAVSVLVRIDFLPTLPDNKMHFSHTLKAALALPLINLVSSAPFMINPGLQQQADIVVTQNNTLNATTWDNASNETARPIQSSINVQAVEDSVNGTSTNQTEVALIEATSSGHLPIRIVNKWDSSNVKAYISGLDSNGALIMLAQNGQWVYPSTTSGKPVPITEDVALPIGPPNSTLPLTLPGYITSARVWISVDDLQFFVVATPSGPGLVQPASANSKDPNAGVNYGFAELTWGPSIGIYADITAVDFVGIPLGMQLQDAEQHTFSVFGTPANAAEVVCNGLKAQAAVDGRPWDKLCVYGSNGQLVRTMAPSDLSVTPNPFGTYYAKYVDDVWAHYTNNDLIINTQSAPGNVTCRVKGDQLTCNGDNRGYAKPNNQDIFGCNTGPFSIQQGDNAVHLAVVPRLCAAFNRATLLLEGGNVQPSLPPSQYYAVDPNRPANSRPMNWYSKLVHEVEVGSRGYAFSYDDVAPSVNEDQSGLVASTTPTTLTIIVGGS